MHKPVTNAPSFKTAGRAVLILLGVLFLVRVVAMAVVPLMDTTEARYGEISRKMAELNDWVTPWFAYGVPYWGKPPLAFWLTAGSFDLLGVHEFAARLPHLIASLTVISLVAWMVSLRDRDAVWPSVVCISSSAVFFISAGAVLTDIELMLGTSFAMVGFWLAVDVPKRADPDHEPGIQGRWFAGSLFFAGLVVGLLAKGPVSLVLVGIPIFLWTALNARWRDTWHRLPWISGTLLTLLVALPWYFIAEQHTPGFLQYFLIGEHFHRFITAGWNGDLYGNAHPSPPGQIWLFAIVGLLPWSVLLPIAAWQWRAPGTTLTALIMTGARAVKGALSPKSSGVRLSDKFWRSYLLVWALAPLLLFTVARNTVWTYVLPGLPAAAILAGQWLATQSRRGCNITPILCSGISLTLALMFVAAVIWSRPATLEKKTSKGLVAAYERSVAEQFVSSGSNRPKLDSAHSGAPLIFVVWRRPFSAEFYTEGKVIEVRDLDEAWQRIGGGAAYVAIYNGNDLVASAAARSKSEEIENNSGDHKTTLIEKRTVRQMGRFGNFDLLFVAAR